MQAVLGMQDLKETLNLINDKGIKYNLRNKHATFKFKNNNENIQIK